MRNLIIVFLCCFIATTSFAQDIQAKKLSKDEKKVVKELESKFGDYSKIAHQIWEYAELGYKEEKSSNLLRTTLEKEGFTLETGVAEIPTAFVATYGSGKPVVAILAEFDALPGVSQDAVPYRKAIIKGGSGHACGHHLFGAGSTAAAIAVKNWLKANGGKGTIRLMGTPAEEGGAGKVYMVRAGLFDDVDVTLHWHPGSSNSASATSSLSNKSAKFRFYGKASHAAAAPERGRSALDGVEAMNYMTNLLREHVPAETRIHYVITSGGEAPNVVPEYAEVFYYVRHPDMKQVKAIFERVVKAAEGAALGTGTRMEYEVIHGLYNVLPNQTLAEKMYANLKTIGGITYDDKEKAFADKIMATYPEVKSNIADATRVKPYIVSYKGTGGSTDVGDVSWAVPTAGLRTATWVPGTSAHTWQAVAAGGTSIGHKGMILASKVMALTAIDVYKNPKLAEKAKAELVKVRGEDFKYEALLGDRKPPLNYRDLK
jgi:aminobenzoyl-glutamate utilization protein B